MSLRTASISPLQKWPNTIFPDFSCIWQSNLGMKAKDYNRDHFKLFFVLFAFNPVIPFVIAFAPYVAGFQHSVFYGAGPIEVAFTFTMAFGRKCDHISFLYRLIFSVLKTWRSASGRMHFTILESDFFIPFGFLWSGFTHCTAKAQPV